MMMIRKNKKGFTLVELVIVIAVLAILAVVAVPVAKGIIDSANESVDVSNVALFSGAIEMSHAKTGSYPASESDAKTAITTYTNVTTVAAKRSGYLFYYSPSETVKIKCVSEDPGGNYKAIP